MAEWFYREAGQLDIPNRIVWLTLRSRELGVPVLAFITNINRIREFWKLSPHLIDRTAAFYIRLWSTAGAVTGEPFLTAEQLADPKIHEEIRSRLMQRFQQEYDETDSAEQAAGHDFERGLDIFSDLVRATPDMDEVIYATLSSQLIAGWIAFETLCADLWTNSKLHQLEKVEKTIFQSLNKIKSNYAAVFANQEIDGVLGDASLSKLAFVRHVILHKSGVVDQIFLDKAESISWQTDAELGKPLPITGVMVRDLINPVIQLAHSLIGAVDRQIAPDAKPQLPDFNDVSYGS